MLALGLLFMIVAAAVTAGAIYDGGESATFEVFGQTVGTTIGGVFIAGLATMLVFFIGVWMLMKSLVRSRRKRLERKEATSRQQQSVSQIEQERAQLRAENDQLQQRLARDRRPDIGSDETTDATGGTGATGGTAAAGGTAAGATAGATADERAVDDRPTYPDSGQRTGATIQQGAANDDRVVDHRTDLTSNDERAAASGRHRDDV